MGLVFASIALALVAGAARAEVSNEFWPELDTWIGLNNATRFLLMTGRTRDRDTGDRINSEAAAYLDYRYSDRISYRAGYAYSDTPPANAGESHSLERRWMVDFSYNWQFGDVTKLTDRVRVDLRNIDGASSTRIRDRLKMEFATHLGHQAVTPYGNLEVFYDTRYDAVSRYRLELGASTPLSKGIAIDLYVGRQRDTRPSNKYTNGIGLTLNLYL
jgi:hypothetical protein